MNNNINNKKILIKTPNCEMSLEDLCRKEYLKINKPLHNVELLFDI